MFVMFFNIQIKLAIKVTSKSSMNLLKHFFDTFFSKRPFLASEHSSYESHIEYLSSILNPAYFHRSLGRNRLVAKGSALNIYTLT